MNKLYEIAIEHLRELLDKLLSYFQGKSELEEFMTSDENLYNDDGSLTEEYKVKIAEMEDYVREHPITDVLQELHMSDEERVADSAVIDFVEKRKELLDDLNERNKDTSGAKHDDERTVDDEKIMEWVDEKLSESDNPMAESDFETLLEDEIIEELDDEDIKNIIQNLDETED